MLTRKESRQLSRILDRTYRLAKYLPSEFDYKVDPFDPVIDEFGMLLTQFKDHPGKMINSEEYMHVLFNALPRHVTPEIRCEFLDILSGLKGKVKPGERELLRTAIVAIEDIGLHPATLGLIEETYRQHIFSVLLARTREMKKKPSAKLSGLVASLKKKFSAQKLNQILNYGNQGLDVIEDQLRNESLTEKQFMNLVRTAAQFSSYRAASLFCYLLVDDFLEIETAVSICDSKLNQMIADYLLSLAERRNPDFFNLWTTFMFLAAIRDQRIIGLFRGELARKREYDVDEDAETAFYIEIVEMICFLDDRRAIPTLIQFLHEGRQKGFSDHIIEQVEDAIMDSPWHEEIIRGVNLLKEGEMVIVPRGESIFDSTFNELSDEDEFFDQDAEDDLQDRLTYHQKRWNEAYHEDLDGLRPIDIPPSKVRNDMLFELLKDFGKNMPVSGFSSEEEEAQYFAEFQESWFLTPLASRNGSIPLVIIMKDEDKLATTEALRGYFQKYKTDRLNSLYLDASMHLENNCPEECRRRIDAILEIEPNYPLAVRLKSKLD